MGQNEQGLGRQRKKELEIRQKRPIGRKKIDWATKSLPADHHEKLVLNDISLEQREE